MQNGKPNNPYFPPPSCRRCHSYDDELRLIDTMITIDHNLQITTLNIYECADRIACTAHIEEQAAAVKESDLEHLYHSKTLPGATKPKRLYVLDERSPNGRRTTRKRAKVGS